MAKNIVIFSDGTGQEGGVGTNTNVYDLFNMIVDRTDRQISFYDRGLGTGWRKVGAMTGMGISGNVREAYEFLSDQFAAGDQIYLFGFSRGAATVRTLSAFIDLFGILPKSRPELFKTAWRIYKMRNREKRRNRAKAFVNRNHTMWTKVRFIGVWDTVDAFGLPFKFLDLIIDRIPFWRHSFHNLALADSVEFARHALAIDDERQTFHPVLWDERGPRPKGTSSQSGVPLFSKADVTHIYQIVKELKNRKSGDDDEADDNPVSTRIYGQLSDTSKELLEGFNRLADGRESIKREDEMRAVIVQEFNDLIDNGFSIYDPQDSELSARIDRMVTSTATDDQIEKLAKSRSPNAIQRLTRLLLEDAYSLQPRIKQVWFAGMHSDVGGGYPEKELGQISLLWMVSEALDLGLLIYDKHPVDLKPDSTGTMHNSRTGLGRLYRKRSRQWIKDEHQGRSPLVHESATRRYAEDPLYDPWILKTEYDVEPWPERLESSIQFDDDRLWRDDFWGWGGKIDPISWDEVERVSCDNSQRVLTVHMTKGSTKVIQGSLPRALPALVEQMERTRERKRLKGRNDAQDRQDEELQNRYSELAQRIERLEKGI